MIDYSPLFARLKKTPLEPWVDALPEQISRALCTQRHGDLPQWYQALAALPEAQPSNSTCRDEVRIGQAGDLTPEQHAQLLHALRSLIPWRKGPFEVFGHRIDTEWRSDWKWQRLLPHISPLEGKCVLDVGCGSGYHAWRMWGAGAREVIGIDPSPRFVVQFYMLKRYWPQAPVDVLPLTLEALPPSLRAFDTCFSMGVFYHRRSPMDHLRELRDCLKPGGELVLETLIIPESEGQVLVPQARYAQMSNVWFIPSVPSLLQWLEKTGFCNARCVDVNQTSTEEQRATPWMQFLSLKDFLDPENPDKTIEGYPAPRRAIIIANRPT
jgi:tRNA (mo5U34)-methyltransferase